MVLNLLRNQLFQIYDRAVSGFGWPNVRVLGFFQSHFLKFGLVPSEDVISAMFLQFNTGLGMMFIANLCTYIFLVR